MNSLNKTWIKKVWKFPGKKHLSYFLEVKMLERQDETIDDFMYIEGFLTRSLYKSENRDFSSDFVRNSS